MEFASEEQKIQEWHKRADEGRRRALRRETYLSCLAILVVVICLILVASVLGLLVLGVIELINYLGRSGNIPIFFKKKKTEGKPPVHDQPERQSIIWIDIFTLNSQDEDIDPINSIRVGRNSSRSNG